MTRRLDEIGPELAAFCRQNHVSRLSVFGSAARGEMRPNSDIDLLVEFEAGRAPSLAGFARLKKSLAGMFAECHHRSGDSQYFAKSISTPRHSCRLEGIVCGLRTASSARAELS
jgi:predicted nucleotidyltransferase